MTRSAAPCASRSCASPGCDAGSAPAPGDQARLLQRVRQLVRDEVLTGAARRLVGAVAEDDRLADGECARADRAGAVCRLRSGDHPRARHVRAHPSRPGVGVGKRHRRPARQRHRQRPLARRHAVGGLPRAGDALGRGHLAGGRAVAIRLKLDALVAPVASTASSLHCKLIVEARAARMKMGTIFRRSTFSLLGFDHAESARRSSRFGATPRRFGATPRSPGYCATPSSAC